MNDLIDTTEMYLKAIVELEEQRIVPLRARIAERLDHSGPTVSQTVARMERDGLVVVHADRRLELTEEGRALATSVMRKHRLAERLLSDVIGLDWELVHDEACRWEHVMSEQVERRLIAILPEHRRGPYGNPVPGLEELGAESESEESVISLAALAEREDAGECTIAWIAEPLQVDHYLLGQLRATGIVPGAAVTVRAEGDYITVAATGSETVLDLPPETAANVFAAC